MKKMIMVGAAGAAVVAFAGLYGDTPDAKHAWSVHDMNRPNPVKMTPADVVGQPPSDAVVLFDGSKESFEKNWCDGKGNPSKWVYNAEEKSFGLPLNMAAGAGRWSTTAGSIQTRAEFGDCQLHLEWKYPANIPGKGQMRGNSGVFLMNNYEIQVMESFTTDPANNENPNYADGQCGAVYAENPPLVNACRKPGNWQTYDIVFHQPVWERGADGKPTGKMLWPGSVTVFQNGVLVQDHWEMEGLTTHCRRRALAPHNVVGPLQLQDHGCPLEYRNIWYRPLKSRYANTTHGGAAANENDVMALRRQTAAKLFAKVDRNRADANNLIALAEVLAYAKEGEQFELFKKLYPAYLATLNGMDAKALATRKGEVINVRNNMMVLQRNGVVGADCKFIAGLKKIIDANNWEPKKK